MLWGLALRVAQPEVPFSLVDGACCVVVGCGLSVCVFLHMTNVGSDAPGVPFHYPVGCGVGCVVSGVCVSFPHRAWVRGLPCFGMLMWFGADGMHRRSLRSHLVARDLGGSGGRGEFFSSCRCLLGIG